MSLSSCSALWLRTFVTQSVKLTMWTLISIWAERLCACSSMPSPPGKGKRICPQWSSNSVSGPAAPGEHAGQTLCPVDVSLGDGPHHPRHQSYCAPGRVGIRLAGRVLALLRVPLFRSGRRCRGGADDAPVE